MDPDFSEALAFLRGTITELTDEIKALKAPKKYEYLRNHYRHGDANELWFNELGADGWKLVGIERTQESDVYTFMREVR